MEKVIKDARLNMKLRASEKAKIEKAAILAGHSTITAFLLDIAMKEAERIIEEKQEFITSEKEAKAFFEIINQEETLHKGLSSSVQRYKERYS